jgi:hypothetical protein
LNECKNYFFLIFGKVEPTARWNGIEQAKTEGLGEKPVGPGTLAAYRKRASF